MSLPKNLKTLRLGYSIVSSTFSSKGGKFSVGDLKPSSCFLQNQLLYRYITTSEVSANQTEYTVGYLIKSCGLSPDDAVPAFKWVKLRSPERPDSVLALLRNHGFSETQISKVVRSFPQVLQADPEKTLFPKLEYFRSLGVSREDLSRTLATNPTILWRSLEKGIKPTFNFLRSVASEKQVIAAFKRSTWMFPNKNVVPNFGLLRELGMSQSCISLCVSQINRIMILNPENLGQVVREVKQMGFNLKKSVSVMAIVALSFTTSKAVINRSRQVYMSRWGWSEDDVLSAFRKFPQCMIVTEKKIMQVMDCLVNKMGWPSGMVAKHPVVMGFSLEKRIIPRCSVVQVLLLKGLLINEKFALTSVLIPGEEQFLKRFVTKYLDRVPQLSSVYQGKVDIQDV
ncbi:hypothetical protein M0R45_036610 [Rubus argutus]|uniref:Uncharacterized protein n=1 Tax=Rubus argutus TaxID=59490 RepID=A0AAW1VXP0_RUBAR